MFSSRSEIVINRPMDVVFDYISHMENDPVWCPEVKRVDPLNDDPPGVGKTYDMMARPIPQDQEGGYEITRFDAPQRNGAQAVARHQHWRYHLRPGTSQPWNTTRVHHERDAHRYRQTL